MNLTVPVNSTKFRRIRYNLFLRGQFLVLAGYSIVIIETFIAIKLGLTPMTVKEIMYLAAGLLGFSVGMILAVYIKKEITVPLEWTLFMTYIIVYIFAYSYWTYRLQELRILGLLTALMAVTLVLTYTNMLQSLMMSFLTFTCHLAVLYFALEVKFQPGNFHQELYLSLCLMPAFVLLSVAAFYVHKKRVEALRVRGELEEMNTDLTEANIMLRFEQSRSNTEMDLAHDIQRSLFPTSPPVDEIWDTAFVSVPSSGVTGDFYDFYMRGNSLRGISLFDVSGHGVASALITILAKPVFFRNFSRFFEGSLDMVFDLSNRELLPELGAVNSFITGIMLRFSGNTIEYINAGHPDILYRGAGSNTVKKIDEEEFRFKGYPIGVKSPDLTYKTLKFTAASGDVLILYSDCLLECRNNAGEFYGDERIFETFAAARGDTAKEIMDFIVNDFYQFAGNNINDDMTLIVLRRK